MSNHKFFHWFYYHQKKHYHFNFGVAVFIWLFLGLTMPFGIYNNNAENYAHLLLFLLPFGLAWPLVSYVTDLLAQKVMAMPVRDNYTLDFRVFIFKIVLLVHVFFIGRNYMCSWSCIDGREYLELWLACSIMLGIAYVPFALYARYRFYHRMVGNSPENPHALLELKGEGKNTLRVPSDQIIFLKADDNYVDVVLEAENGPPQVRVIRASLKSLAGQLQAHSQFVQVHRSFIVNFQYVRNLNRSDSVNVVAGDYSQEIPVSKKYRKDLSQLIG